MILKDVHPVIREALCCQQAFRRLGFKAEDVYTVSDRDGNVGVRLCHGGSEFLILVDKDPVFQDHDLFSRLWVEAVRLSNNVASNEELLQLWEGSSIRKKLPDLVAGLIARGFEMPSLPNLKVPKPVNKALN